MSVERRCPYLRASFPSFSSLGWSAWISHVTVNIRSGIQEMKRNALAHGHAHFLVLRCSTVTDLDLWGESLQNAASPVGDRPPSPAFTCVRAVNYLVFRAEEANEMLGFCSITGPSFAVVTQFFYCTCRNLLTSVNFYITFFFSLMNSKTRIKQLGRANNRAVSTRPVVTSVEMCT